MFSNIELKHLIEESQIMSKFNHPNVMKLLGVAISRRHETLYILMPYMTQGSLLSYLKKCRTDLMVEYEDMTDLVSKTLGIIVPLFILCMRRQSFMDICQSLIILYYMYLVGVHQSMCTVCEAIKLNAFVFIDKDLKCVYL